MKTWKLLGVLFALVTMFGFFHFIPETAYNFGHRFFRSAIWQILGPVVGSVIFYKTAQKVKSLDLDGAQAWKTLLLGAVIFWGGLFGPVAGFKLDRKASIPDVSVYYANGTVINATDASKENYYFKHFTLNAVDSVYVVTYGEEPGHNHYGGGQHSTAPRANEDWTRPNTNESK